MSKLELLFYAIAAAAVLFGLLYVVGIIGIARPWERAPEPDTSDIPEVGKDWFEKARLRHIQAEEVMSMLLLCGEEGGKRKDESPAQYLRRLIDALIEAKQKIYSLEDWQD